MSKLFTVAPEHYRFVPEPPRALTHPSIAPLRVIIAAGAQGVRVGSINRFDEAHLEAAGYIKRHLRTMTLRATAAGISWAARQPA